MKHFKKIEITTINNGYSLNIEGNRYLYYSLNELLDGFIFHVGLNELDAVDNETRQSIIDAALKWQDNESLVKELLTLKTKHEIVTRQVKNLKKELERFRPEKKTRKKIKLS